MSRYSDRYMEGQEWEDLQKDVVDGMDLDEIRTKYGLSKRNTTRSVRRAQKHLGIECTIPSEESGSRAGSDSSGRSESRLGRGSRSGSRNAAETLDMSPIKRTTLSPDWTYLTPIEKAQRLIPGRIGKLNDGDYTLDGHRTNFRSILITCNRLLAAEGLDQIPGPNVLVSV